MSGEIKPSNSESAMATSSSSSQKNVSDVGSFSNPPPSTTWSPKELTPSQKLLKKSKETPYVPIGIAGTVATVAYAVYAYKNRGPMSTSRYVMKFRVLAQGAVVGAMIVGAIMGSRNVAE